MKTVDVLSKALAPSGVFKAAPALTNDYAPGGGVGRLTFDNAGTVGGLNWKHDFSFSSTIDGMDSASVVKVKPPVAAGDKLVSRVEWNARRGNLALKVTAKNPFGEVASAASNDLDLTETTTATATVTTVTKTTTTITKTTTTIRPKKYHVYAYTGKHQTFTVPTGITEVQAYMWGGSGSTMSKSLKGGASGYSQGLLKVKPTEKYTITVGGCGKKFGTTGNSGGGGGLSGIFRNSYNKGNSIMIAAGGGGAGSGHPGGAGGGASGQRGIGGSNGGHPGTQSGPGRNPGGYSGSSTCIANPHGGALQGGVGTGCERTGTGGFGGGGHGGGQTGTNGGGGGGGFWGGGGGGGSPNSGAGGGGSGYIKPGSVSKGLTKAGNGHKLHDGTVRGGGPKSTPYKLAEKEAKYPPGVPMADDDKTKCDGHGAIILHY